jgi:hypothetical protein
MRISRLQLAADLIFAPYFARGAERNKQIDEQFKYHEQDRLSILGRGLTCCIIKLLSIFHVS